MIPANMNIRGKCALSFVCQSMKMANRNHHHLSRTANANTLKYISLLTLTLQNAILGLSMRYARTRPGEIFLSSTGARGCRVGTHTHTHTSSCTHTIVENFQII